MFNLGSPEILNISLVSNLNKIKIIKGREVIK